MQVSCGARHTMVRGSQGEAYSWGWNKYGQLGLGDTEQRRMPQCVHVGGIVADVACGWWHSTLLVKSDTHASQL